MPFRSQAQRRWMYENNPDMAKRWESETPTNANLPEHVGRQTKFKKPTGRLDGRRKAMKRLGLKKSHFA